ncbi:MAG TPA: phosphoribosylformylglycinamidine cyclo-ligase, partial [Candidatus Acidoferrales bacterium]|nr:phosphoribosylformylglycinamidine cyclo-ligase [Candidatus Acidoferrales bacterium]
MAEAGAKGAAPRPAYARAGVDVAAGDRAVELMRSAIDSTRRPEVVGSIGGFAGAVAIPAGYREPLIVSSTDGVGTKTAIAAALGRWDSVGIDLVAMCADDVVCSGAEPLAFLDYIAVGRIEPEAVAELVGGVAAGCVLAGCALVGGETAEHPGLMEAGTFDLAGTCLGIVERADVLDGSASRAGDVVVGLPSSGLHSNGFTLVRALLAQYQVPLDRPYQEQLTLSLGDAERDAILAREPQHALATVGDVLLTPTRIYARDVLLGRAAVRAAGFDVH